MNFPPKRSSSDYTASDTVSGLQTLFNQLPELPQLPGSTIQSKLVPKPIKLAAQFHYDSKQPISSQQPLISTCDKSSIQDISDKLRSLNSSISDAVDALMQEKVKHCYIALRNANDDKRLSPLIRMAITVCHKQTKNKNMQVRNKFQNAILHDLIIQFIYDIIEGERKEEISHDYKKFRADIENVRKTEAFADAQNWIRIAGKLFVAPPDTIWKKLANTLNNELNTQLWRIGGPKSEARRRNVVKRITASQYFPVIIKTAFDISMEIYSGILSQRLKLTVGMKGLYVDPGEVEMGEDLTEVTSTQPKSGCRNHIILGNRGLGLATELDDGIEKVYLKPIVDYS